MTDRPALKPTRRAAKVVMTFLSWLLAMLWVIRPGLASGLQHTHWALQSPVTTDTPTPTPYATFTADSTTIVAGTCTWLRWNVGNAQSVRVEGQPKPLSGSMPVCPTTNTIYRLQLFTADGEQERLLRITVLSQTPTPTFTPTRTPTPFLTFTPTRTPTTIPTQIPTPTWTPPSEQFPPPSLMGPVTPVPTTPVVEQPTPPPATVEAPAPSPTPVAEALSEERPALEQPQEPARREPVRRTPPPQIEGTRQDVVRLLAFGLVGIASATVLGLISLILWWRRL